jgi:type IV pilus assembly protein PilM
MSGKTHLFEKTGFRGLEIGIDFIRICLLEKKESGYEVQKLIVAPTPPEFFQNGFLTNSQALGSLLKRLWRTNKIGTRKVALSIATKGSLLRVLNIPYVDKNQLGKVLMERVSQYLTFAGLKVEIGWEILEAFTKEEQRYLKVFLAVSRRDLLDYYLKALEIARLELVAITLPALAVLRNLSESFEKSGRGKKIFVYVEEEVTHFFIIKDTAVDFVHPFDIGVKEIFSDEKKKAAFEEEVARLVASNSEVTEFLCSGTTDKIGDIVSALTQRTGRNFSSIGAGETETVIGLARKEAFKINLLPADIVLKQGLVKDLARFLYGVIFLSVAMVVVFFILFFSNIVLSQKISRYKERMKVFNEQFSEVADMEAKVLEVQQLIESRQNMYQQYSYFYWGDLLNELAQVVPGALRLKRVEIKPDGTAVIYGEFLVRDGVTWVFNFIDNFKKSTYFKNVNLSSIEQARPESGLAGEARQNFSLILEVNVPPSGQKVAAPLK